jgi:hypothetical protein
VGSISLFNNAEVDPVNAHLRQSRKRWVIALFKALKTLKRHQLQLRFVKVGGMPGNVSISYMTDRKDRIPWLLLDQTESLVDQDSPHFREFQQVSENFLRGYRRFVDLGFPSEAIGLAMLGATINMYTMLEIHKELPDLLRKLADRIEHESQLH